MTTETVSHTTAELLERIVDAPRNLVVLEGADGDELVRELRVLARRSGQTLYLWREHSGLLSMRDGGSQVPVGGGLSHALRFIARSMHFGIYFMQLEIGRLTRGNVRRLIDISHLGDAPARRVVLFGHSADLPAELASECLLLRIAGGDQARPRLRDGRWVR